VLHRLNKRVLEVDFHVLGLHLELVNIRLENISHTKSRLPIPRGIVDRLVATVLVAVDVHPFLSCTISSLEKSAGTTKLSCHLRVLGRICAGRLDLPALDIGVRQRLTLAFLSRK
jgi:hypothetical protein